MGLLDNVERGLERLVNGVFSKSYRGSVQPVEIVAALKREMDSRAMVVGRDRILAPHSYTVGLSAQNFTELSAHGSVLVDELITAIRKYAHQQRYSFSAPVSVTLAAASDIPIGVVRVASKPLDAVSEWEPTIEINGKVHQLTQAETILGRGSTANITLSDGGASRHHAKIHWNGKTGAIEDLGSTNGTLLNGSPVTKATLEQGDVIKIGDTSIIFRVSPGAGS